MKKAILYGIFIINLGIIIGFWYTSEHNLIGISAPQTVIALARVCGLLAAFLVLTQVLLIGRASWIERLFGLDKLARVHHWNGYALFGFLALHPLLMTWGYAAANGVTLPTQFIDFLNNWHDIAGALMGFLLFVAIVIFSITITRNPDARDARSGSRPERRGRLKYETWYFTHLFVYAAILLAFGHQIENGGTLTGSPLFQQYWIALYVFVFGNLVLYRFIKPVYYFYKHQFEVARIVEETENTVSLYIKANNLDQFPIQAGQFMIVRFLTRDAWWQAHPFSLSCAPNANHLRITVKNSGDFTAQIKNIPVGTKIIIDGPHGIFTEHAATKDKFVMIAGGIGITPIRALTETLLGKGKEIIVLYGNRRAREIVFKNELETLGAQGDLKVHHVLSEEEVHGFERGVIDRERIKKLVPDLHEREIYLCGPIPMMNAVRGTLHELGVPHAQIHFEKFAL